MIATIEQGTPSPDRPSLLFVHGAMHAAWAWEEHFLPYFAEHGWHGVALDLRGHGNSPSATSVTWVSVRDYIADVTEIATRFTRPPIMIGHSLGGFVVQRYLEDHDTPAAVLIGSTPPTGVRRLTTRASRRSPLGAVRTFTTFKLLHLFGKPDAARYWFFSGTTSDQQVAEYAGRLQEESFRAVMDTLVRPVRTKRVSTPLLVLSGSLDHTIPPSDQRIAARKYGLEPVIIEGLPHDLMLDPNWEQAASRVFDWIRGVTGDP